MSKKRGRAKPTDDIKKLSELDKDDERINVIAVTHLTTIPTLTKGAKGDYLVKFELIDDSTDEITTCQLFGKLDFLPDVTTYTHPTIIRLRRFQVEVINDRLCLTITPGYSYAMFDKDTDLLIPQDKSHENTALKLTEAEVDRIQELREWVRLDKHLTTQFRKTPANTNAVSVNQQQRTKKFNKYFTGFVKICDLEEDLYFDLVCQVIGVRSDNDRSVLRCIDGTETKLKTFKTNSLYLTTNLTQIELAQLFDLYVDVVVYDEHNVTVPAIKVGDYVEFRNLHCYTPPTGNVPEIILHKGSQFKRGLKILYGDRTEVPRVKSQIEKVEVYSPDSWAVTEVPPYDPESAFLTELAAPNLPVSSILEIMSHPKSGTKYRIRVFVDRFTPDNFPSFIEPFCGECQKFSVDPGQCADCGNVELKSELCFSLHVRDLSDGLECELRCLAASAREFLGLKGDSRFSMGELEVVTGLVGRWTDLVVECVEMDRVGSEWALVIRGCSLGEDVVYTQQTM